MKFDLMQYMLGNVDVYGIERKEPLYDRKGYVGFGEYLYSMFHPYVSNRLFKNITSGIEFKGVDTKNFAAYVTMANNVVAVKLVNNNTYENLKLLGDVIKKELLKFLGHESFTVHINTVSDFVHYYFCQF